MVNNPSESEAVRIDATLPQFIKELFTNYKDFLKTHLIAEKPPFLFMVVWLLGMSSIIGRIEMRYVSTQEVQLDNWILIWALIVMGGLISGYLSYWIGGALYHLRVWLSGGSGDYKISKNLFLYTGLPLYFAIIFSEIVDTFVYGSRYFTEPTHMVLDLVLSVLCIAGIIYAISLSYRGVCLLQKTKRVPSIIFFVVLPAIFYAVSSGGTLYKFTGLLSHRTDYKEQGIEVMFKGDYDEAEKLFIRALKTMNKNDRKDLIRVCGHLGQLYEYKGLSHEAVDSYEKGLSFAEPESSDYHSMLGKINILNGDTQKAIGNFEKSLVLNPYDSYSHSQLGLIFLGRVDSEIKDYERALIHNEEAYALNKGLYQKQNLAINYYLLNRYSDALPLFESLNTLSPKNALAKYCMGRIYYSNKQLNKAKTFLKEAITLDPSLPTADIEHIIKD